MKIVNVETKLHVVYGIVDDDGDCIKKVPYTLEIPKHDLATMQSLVNYLAQQREELSQEIEKAAQDLAEQNPE